jgi:hypothetical protein
MCVCLFPRACGGAGMDGGREGGKNRRLSVSRNRRPTVIDFHESIIYGFIIALVPSPIPCRTLQVNM